MADHGAAIRTPETMRWHGDGLRARTIRFTLTVTAPLVAGLVVGDGTWIAYGVLTGILAFTIDTGGSVLERVATHLAAGAVILAGAGLGTLAGGSTVTVTAALVLVGMLYALTEQTHPSIALAGRFLCITLPIGALYVPVAPADVAAVAWTVAYSFAISVIWDAAVGVWRPSTGPRLTAVAERLRATGPEIVVFAIVVGAAVAADFLTALNIGVEKAHWALFALVLVVRSDETTGRQLAWHLLIGTPIGAFIALFYSELVPTQFGLAVGMTVAALLRWPAQAIHGCLGFAALTAFIILLIDLIALDTGVDGNPPFERIIDITLGCAFAVAALSVNHAAQRMLRRWRGAPGSEAADVRPRP
jgi:hypothetical protein